MLAISIFIFLLFPLIFFIFKLIKIKNHLYLIKFLFFYILTIIYSLFYLLFFFFFFIFKNLRFFEFFYVSEYVFDNKSKLIFKRQFIYFLFWRYIFIFLWKYLFNFLIYILYNIKYIYIKFLYINNVYVITTIFLQINLILYNNLFLNFFLNFIQYFYIRVLYYILYIINIDDVYNVLKRFNVLNIDKYSEDPLLFRNYFLKIPLNFYYIYINFKNILIKYKLFYNYSYFYNIFIIVIFQMMHKLSSLNYNNFFYLYNFFLKKIILIFFLKKNYINISKAMMFKFILLMLYFLNFLVVNFIYLFLNFFFFIVYVVLYSLTASRKKLIYLFIFMLLIKYFWVVNYFLFVIYKHYSLYFPLNEVKESFRFLNFEWIDLRNYYNLLIWHNTLVDLSIHNNIIYTNILKNLYKDLSLYGFKSTKLHNIQFKSINLEKQKWDEAANVLWKNRVLKDTELLNNLMHDQNKALSLNKYYKYRFLKKHMLIKLKVQFKVTKWNRIYMHRKNAHNVPYSLKSLFDNKITVVNDEIYKMDDFNLFKNLLPLKEPIKDQLSLLSFYYRGSLRKKISPKYIALPISKYIRLRNIPFSKLVLQHKKKINATNLQRVIRHLDIALRKQCNELFNWGNKNSQFTLFYKLVIRAINKYLWEIRYSKDKKNHFYFFKRIYKYKAYKKNMRYKNKIPTYIWVESLWKRRVTKPLISLYGVTNVAEAYTLHTYHDLIKRNISVKSRYFYKFIFSKYPYRLNKGRGVLSSYKYYFDLLPKGVKIMKKYIFLRNLKRKQNFKFHTNFFESNKLYSLIMLKKFQNWNSPFANNYLNFHVFNKFLKLKLEAWLELHKVHFLKMARVYLKRLKYWNFFDYLKVNKYYMYKYEDIYKNKNVDSINLQFIKRFRKDYINARNSLIRFMSSYFYYEYYKKVVQLYNDRLKYTKRRRVRKFRGLIKPEVINFRIKWSFNIYLTHKKDKVNNLNYIYVLCNLFKEKFKIYNDYINLKINLHNKIYKKNVNTYRISTLNRISNLKRFFYYRTKRFNGWAIWNYFRSFSFKFHIKHLLWHSPYSYLFFDDNNILNILNIKNAKNDIKLRNNINILDKFIFDYTHSYDLNFNVNRIIPKFYSYQALKNYNFKSGLLSFIDNTFKKNKNVEEAMLQDAFRYLKGKVVIVKLNKYSSIFNLYLNILDIKENWSYIVSSNISNSDRYLFEDTFFNYYNLGSYSNFKSFRMIDAYRLCISLLFHYYNSFLYKLSRYIYILHMKDYTLIKFIKRYFNIKSWLSHFFIKFRTEVSSTYMFGKSIENKFYKWVVDKKNKYASKVRRIEIAPLWFIFYKYIKIFIYFLLKKYYTKFFFAKWWLNFKLNFSLLFKLAVLYYGLKYKFDINILNIYNFIYYMRLNYIISFIFSYLKIFIYDCNLFYNHFYNNLKLKYEYELNYMYNSYKLLDCNMFYGFSYIYSYLKIDLNYLINNYNNFFIKHYNKMLNLFNNFSLSFCKYLIFKIISIKNDLFFSYNNLNLFIWYFKTMFNSHALNYIFKINWVINYSKIKLIIKVFLLKKNLNFNLNFFLFYKFYVKSLLKYYMNALFKIKNNMVYFKSNYFYYRQTKSISKLRKFKTKLSISFLNVKTRRNYNSFYNLTPNKFFLKDLYNFNLNTYIYIWSRYDIKFDTKLLFTPFVFLKYNFGGYLFILFLGFYLVFLFFLYVFYKKFFNIFFFSKNVKYVNVNTQYNWDLFINKSAIKILKLSKKSRLLYYNHILKKKYFNNYYSFFIDKVNNNFNEKLYLKPFMAALLNNKYYKNLKKNINLNNSILIDVSKQKLFINFPYIYSNKLVKSKRFMNLFNFNFFVYKKENKKYYLSSNNYIYSNNMFYFFIFYWLFLIPLFFIEYLLFRYNLRGHVLKKYKVFIYLKVFFDNFKAYVKIIKLFGDQVFYRKFKSRYVRNDLSWHIGRKKKKLRNNFFFKWDRLNSIYLRISPLGSYYYWFAHINKWHYFICYYKYFFNTIYKSFYIKYFSIFYFLLCYLVYRRFYSFSNKLYNIKYKIFNVYKIRNLLNILKFK